VEGKKAKIQIDVHFNQDKLPEKIFWEADSNASEKKKDSKAMLLFLFDRDTKDTLKIDLWTHDFEVMEMDRLMFNAIRSLTDTYVRATNNKELAGAMNQFANYFGEKTGIIPTTE